MSDAAPLLRVENLHVEFSTHLGVVRAVRGVDFTVARGETVGVVGESGCGKSVTALSIMRLVARPNGRISAGHIWLHDEQGKATDVTNLGFDSRQMRSIRGGDVTMVFQEPMTSLNPSYSVGFQIMETVLHHQPVSKLRAREMAVAALRGVNMPDPDDVVDRYPPPTVGRHAPAGDAGHGHGVQPAPADRGRAYHRARRHGPGADPGPGGTGPRQAGDGDSVDHPRPGRGG